MTLTEKVVLSAQVDRDVRTELERRALEADRKKPHMTRHTFATDVLDATEGDLYAVKELLGHSSTSVTEVYLHSSRTRTESAIRALSEYRQKNRQNDGA